MPTLKPYRAMTVDGVRLLYRGYENQGPSPLIGCAISLFTVFTFLAPILIFSLVVYSRGVPALDPSGVFIVLVWLGASCTAPFIVPPVLSMQINGLIRSRLGEPLLEVSSARLRRKDKLDVHLVQEVKRDLKVKTVILQFVMRETTLVTFGSGSSVHTKARVIDEVVHPGRDFQRGETLTARASFGVPDDAMHTFYRPTNQIQWFVDVRIVLDVRIGREFKECFEVQVEPERA